MPVNIQNWNSLNIKPRLGFVVALLMCLCLKKWCCLCNWYQVCKKKEKETSSYAWHTITVPNDPVLKKILIYAELNNASVELND